ncbi:MAG: GNAT family N-acetyltransferase [Xanthobacteraceae bacterium]|nr:MAG: GNAT family N-acetyltransferase [Xanthobacteraceae bacterium]
MDGASPSQPIRTLHDWPQALARIPQAAWLALAELAIEPNAYHLPDWLSALARGEAQALTAWSELPTRRLIGLVPVIPFRRAYGLPLPALVSFDPYHTLGTPLIDRDASDEAAARLLRCARDSGAHVLVLRAVTLDGPAAAAFHRILAWDGLAPRILHPHRRACLDATRDPDELLQDALGPKKLKELRRQRHRLADHHGAVTFTVARTPREVATALDTFLALEAAGWKGRRGSALANDAGDAAFIRAAATALAARGQCEIVILRAGATPVAAAIVPRHLGRAVYFKIAIDEGFAKYSPGVQLTLDLTRHLCADPAIVSADSTATAGHPMIDPIWRGRLAIGDMVIPLRGGKAAAGLIHAALACRETARAGLAPLVHRLRRRRETRR